MRGIRNSVTALGEERISKLVLRFSMATLTALLLNAVYTLTDALFVSWGVGNDAMGGVSIAFPFIILQGAISTAVGGGAASIVSRRMGEDQRAQAGEVTLNAMVTFYTTAAATTALGLIFLDPMLRFLGVTGELYPYARQYLIILLIGNVFSTGFSAVIRAEVRRLYSLLIWVIPVSINIVLDAVFVLLVGMGVRGSALATVISQFTSFVMSVLFFTRLTAQSFKGARIQLRRIGEIVAIGTPSLVQMGSLSLMTVVLNNVLRTVGGTQGVTTYAYISKIMLVLVVPFTALTQALAPIAGYNFGAGRHDRVRETVRLCAALALGYALVAFLAGELIPGAMLRLMTGEPTLIDSGVTGLRILSISFFFLPLPMLAGAACQAMGRKLWALVLYACSLLFLVPLTLLLAGQFGMNGVWWAYVAANACATLVALVKLMSGSEKLLRG